MPRRKGDDITFLELQLYRIAGALEVLIRKVDEVSEGQAALDASIGDVQATANQILEVVTSIIAKLQSSPNAPDFTNEIANLESIATGLHGGAVNGDAALEPTPAGGGSGFAITSVSPESGPSGTSVDISGTGFGAIVAVYFGGQAAASFAVRSDTLATAVPASAGDGSGSLELHDAVGNVARGTFTNTDGAPVQAPADQSVAEPGTGEAPPEPPPTGQ